MRFSTVSLASLFVLSPICFKAVQKLRPAATPPVSSVNKVMGETQAVASCLVTKPPVPPFVPPAPFSSRNHQGNFWFGARRLWTRLPESGMWSLAHSSPNSPAYTQKLFWWREGYEWEAEPRPRLIVSGTRLDAPAPPLVASQAVGSFAGGSVMLVGADFPTSGCWKVTGRYRDQELSYVVLIAH
jgi:hypothetical protein